MEVVEVTAEVIPPEEVPGKKTRKKKTEATDLVTTRLLEEEKYGRDVLAFVSNWALTSQKDVDQAGELMAEAFEKKKALKAELKSITDDMRSAEQKVRNKWKPAIQFFESVEETIKTKLREFVLAQKAAQDAALAEVAESGGQASAETLVTAHGHDQLQAPETASVRRSLDFKVVEESQIPEKYFIRVLNKDMIRAEIKATDGKCQIPGVEVFEDVQIVNARRG